MYFLRSVPRDKEESIWKDDGSKDWDHLGLQRTKINILVEAKLPLTVKSKMTP